MMMISNIMFARFLVMSIVLEPWTHGVVPPSAQNKQSIANFKHIASLLLHAYNLALASLTGIPVSLLRPVTAADGLLQATDEGFQVMLRYCEEEWLQQLKASIQAWLIFIMQNVSPLPVDASQSQQQQQQQQQAAPSEPAAAAEVLAIPEVRAPIFVSRPMYPLNIYIISLHARNNSYAYDT